MQKQLMSAEEIHAFGIEVVCKYLQKDGHEIIEINTTPGINPQIVARKDEGLEFIVVRTACYPDKGQIESEQLALQCIAHADRHHAICYFASVGIANAQGATEQEMALPIKGAGFYVAYEGLVILTRSDRVRRMK